MLSKATFVKFPDLTAPSHKILSPNTQPYELNILIYQSPGQGFLFLSTPMHLLEIEHHPLIRNNYRSYFKRSIDHNCLWINRPNIGVKIWKNSLLESQVERSHWFNPLFEVINLPKIYILFMLNYLFGCEWGHNLWLSMLY